MIKIHTQADFLFKNFVFVCVCVRVCGLFHSSHMCTMLYNIHTKHQCFGHRHRHEHGNRNNHSKDTDMETDTDTDTNTDTDTVTDTDTETDTDIDADTETDADTDTDTNIRTQADFLFKNCVCVFACV